MNGYLVDTNILSELTRPLPEARVEAFLHKSKTRVFVSVLSIGEIRKGIASLPMSNKRASLEEWLADEIMPWFGVRVLPGKLVAVIVSGLDGDGAEALSSIKKVGGITIAQSPDTAEWADMPEAAIKTGNIDFVLSVEDIAQKIAHIAQEFPGKAI